MLPVITLIFQDYNYDEVLSLASDDLYSFARLATRIPVKVGQKAQSQARTQSSQLILKELNKYVRKNLQEFAVSSTQPFRCRNRPTLISSRSLSRSRAR